MASDARMPSGITTAHAASSGRQTSDPNPNPPRHGCATARVEHRAYLRLPSAIAHHHMKAKAAPSPDNSPTTGKGLVHGPWRTQHDTPAKLARMARLSGPG
jgi:hypothetical protein